jgi:hypothetical protein
VLSSAVIGVVLSKYKYRWFAGAIMITLLLASLFWLFYNASRPLIGFDGRTSILKSARVDQYFNSRPFLKDSYYKAAELAKGENCKDIGLRLGKDDWEYPIWVFLRNMGKEMPRIEHVEVTNKSGEIPLYNFEPCILLQTERDKTLSLSIPDKHKEQGVSAPNY